jgi:beta-glucosidase
MKHIQQRDNRWCIVDLVGKHGRVRTIPMPTWVKVAIDTWAVPCGITDGHVLRRVSRGDVAHDEGMSEKVVQAMVATGKPVIAFLFNGRPLSINALSRDVPVIFECWYLGQETGHAVAEVLFGDCNPGGKLPITIPRSAGHLPAFYNYKPTARRGYLFDDVTPLYPFGFGLSYTTFAIANVHLDKKRIKQGTSTRVSAGVTNTGDRAGSEIVQMYIRDLVSSATRPMKELKGFRRIVLEPGESSTVTFDITPDLLSFYDADMKFTVEPGDFEIMVGNSSRDADLQKAILTVQ